jgi:hypothetical protein
MVTAGNALPAASFMVMDMRDPWFEMDGGQTRGHARAGRAAPVPDAWHGAVEGLVARRGDRLDIAGPGPGRPVRRASAPGGGARRTRGVGLRMDLGQLPVFTLWKNTVSARDGYVTGL